MSRPSGTPIIEEITIDAPAERVFEALVNPDERVKWWGAEGSFQATQMESDLRPGGRWRMRGLRMNGQPFAIVGEYRQVVRPRLLIFTWLPDWQENASVSLVRIDLEEHDGVTTVRLTHSGLTDEALRAGHRGWPQILAWLRAHAERLDPRAIQ
ncbi:MAG TPA: SRPBCC domain-containing protein [Vicinamibacterales bacterium]|nr:SRPBCC domain-containing protein [Vicinamibacterales bacterium]